MRGLKSLCPLSWQKNDCTLLTLWVFYLNEHVVVFLVTKHNFLFTDLETPKTKSLAELLKKKDFSHFLYVGDMKVYNQK